VFVDISVIIVSYNVKEFLRGAIASVERSLKAGNLTGEILVVDNDSSDGSAAMVAAEFPNVKLYALDHNLGFGRANNLALRDAKGEQLLLLNPDTIVAEDTLRTMVDFMRDNPAAGLAGCKLLNGDGTFQLSCRRGFPTPWASFTKLFGLATLFPNSSLFARYHLTYLPVDKTYEIDALMGAFMIMSRPAYEATRGFDEQFFMYGEDIDLCYRAKEAGFKVFYVHSTATIHFKGESTRRSAINEVSVFYEAMHVFVKKHYRASFLFTALLRIGIFLRTVLALLKKYRGAIVLATLDYVIMAVAVLLGTKLYTGAWMGLPDWDYPGALIVPSAIVVSLLAILQAYSQRERRNARQIVIAMPAILIALSSLTYFFKEFPASRAIVISVTVCATVLLLINRFALRIADRFRWGGYQSATPALRRTLVVGTTSEAIRIATLLQRSEFIRRYEVVGLLDRSLKQLNSEPSPGLPIIGDIQMASKVIAERRVTEVIFASDALSYTQMLDLMQRVSSENVSMPVNFSVVPSATEVLLGRNKIELLSQDPNIQVALIPVQYKLHKLSHRIGKRLLDICVSGAALPFVAFSYLLRPQPSRRTTLDDWMRIFRGELSLVGMERVNDDTDRFAKKGFTSLAAVAASSRLRDEDIAQFDQYYARNHTIGMDCEILIKRMLLRK
jgi:GT2 family glycosyltransferase